MVMAISCRGQPFQRIQKDLNNALDKRISPIEQNNTNAAFEMQWIAGSRQWVETTILKEQPLRGFK